MRNSEGVRERNRKASENKKQNEFFELIFWNFKIISKTLTNVMCYLALHHWWMFCTNWTSLGGVIHEKSPKSSLKLFAVPS